MSDPHAPAAAPAPRFTLDEQMAAISQVFGEEYANNFQDPLIFMEALFKSPTVKQFYKREFQLISRTLFVESVYRRRPTYNQAVLDDFAAVSARKLGDISKLLNTTCERLRVICKTNGVDPEVTYLHPERKIVPIIASHAKTYIATLYKLDELYQLTGSANLNGLIDGSARMKAELLCRKAVRAFSAMLRNEIMKLYKESQRMRAAAGSVADPEMDRAEAAHGQAVAEFDEKRTEDAESAVDPANASQVIEDIAASTAAAGAKGRKKKTDEPEGVADEAGATGVTA